MLENIDKIYNTIDNINNKFDKILSEKGFSGSKNIVSEDPNKKFSKLLKYEMESLNSPQNTSVNVSSEIDKAIKTAAAKHKVDEKLIRSLIKAESGFDVSAVSKKGAIGLMQLMPETAKSLGVRNPLDISENIDAGTKYFKRLMKNYDNNLDLSLAAYNAGPGNVKKYKGIPPFEETQSYIKKIKENLEYYKNVEI